MKSSSNLYADEISRAGLRVTPQRLAILEHLRHSDAHPTAANVFEALQPVHPSLSLATVYNTLECFANLGMITALGKAGDEAVHYDGDTHPHINLACTACHAILDLPSNAATSLAEEVKSRTGYHLLGASLVYYGLCPDCQTRTHR